LTLEPTVIDQAEFARVEWFWHRRPNVLLENLIVLFGYAIVFVCLLYRIPEDLPALFLDGSRSELGFRRMVSS
jgi:hypothetical protein